MTKLEELYNGLKNMLGEEVKAGANITKRTAKEDNWTYDFYFIQGKLSKVECYNHREFIEVWNK